MEHILYKTTEEGEKAFACTGKSARNADWTDRHLPMDLKERKHHLRKKGLGNAFL